MTLAPAPSAARSQRAGRRRPGKRRRPLRARRSFAECRGEVRETHLAFALTRTRALRNELMEAHAGLARQLAARFAGRGETLEDLHQVAQIGLLKAVERYDPSRGTSFATFATPTIVGELKRHFRDRVWPVRVPRSLQDLYLRCRDSAELLRHETGRSPTCEQIAEHLGTAADEVREALAAGASFRTVPMAAPADEAPAAPPPAVSDEDKMRRVEDRLVLGDIVAQLPVLERQVVVLRVFDNLTQSEIAERVGVSQVQVSRLLARVTRRLREREPEQDCVEDHEEGNAPAALA